MYKRDIKLPKDQLDSFFLWGPRQTGKSHLLRERYPDAPRIDLLKSEEFRKYLQSPEMLRLEFHDRSKTPFVIIDEIQKVPSLLDEVQWLMEEKGIKFCLCGSSARKLKRGHANLLGGRALRYELFGMRANELGKDFDLVRILNRGYLPRIYQSEKSNRYWAAYVADYLKDEVAAEALVRNLPAFSEFLEQSALSDSEIVSFKNYSRDVGVAATTIKGYFQILQDTMLGKLVRPFLWRPKRRTIETSKFYFFDVGITNHLAKRGALTHKTELFGKAFENWVHHELRCWLSYSESDQDLSFWRLSSGIEVDFIVGRAEIAIEAKATPNVGDRELRGLREFRKEYPSCANFWLVSLSDRSWKTEDGIHVLSVKDFLKKLT